MLRCYTASLPGLPGGWIWPPQQLAASRGPCIRCPLLLWGPGHPIKVSLFLLGVLQSNITCSHFWPPEGAPKQPQKTPCWSVAPPQHLPSHHTSASLTQHCQKRPFLSRGRQLFRGLWHGLGWLWDREFNPLWCLAPRVTNPAPVSHGGVTHGAESAPSHPPTQPTLRHPVRSQEDPPSRDGF